jgi:hypothetical protein
VEENVTLSASYRPLTLGQKACVRRQALATAAVG